MLILKFRKYNNSLYKLSSDFQIVTVLGLQFIIFILQQLHNLITTALLICQDNLICLDSLGCPDILVCLETPLCPENQLCLITNCLFSIAFCQ